MKFYRYEAREYAVLDYDGEYVTSSIPNPRLEVQEYELVKETPKGYWIGLYVKQYDKPYWKKWIPKKSRSRYAYPTKEEALENYIKRTERRISILKRQLWSSEIALRTAKATKNVEA